MDADHMMKLLSVLNYLDESRYPFATLILYGDGSGRIVQDEITLFDFHNLPELATWTDRMYQQVTDSPDKWTYHKSNGC